MLLCLVRQIICKAGLAYNIHGAITNTSLFLIFHPHWLLHAFWSTGTAPDTTHPMRARSRYKTSTLDCRAMAPHQPGAGSGCRVLQTRRRWISPEPPFSSLLVASRTVNSWNSPNKQTGSPRVPTGKQLPNGGRAREKLAQRATPMKAQRAAHFQSQA